MPAHKRLRDSEIDELMERFASSRVSVHTFCQDNKLAVPTFRRWKREWDAKRKTARLAALPEKPLAWMPPQALSGHGRDAASQDPLLALIVDLADNLGPHTTQQVRVSVCTGGLIVSGRLIGGQEYFAQMRGFVQQGASDLPEQYRREVDAAMERLLPDTERLPERREDWDEYYAPDEFRDAPEFIHLCDVTIASGSQTTQAKLWRGRLAAVTSFWTETDSDANSPLINVPDQGLK